MAPIASPMWCRCAFLTAEHGNVGAFLRGQFAHDFKHAVFVGTVQPTDEIVHERICIVFCERLPQRAGHGVHT